MDPCVHSVQGKARQADENIRNSIALGLFDRWSMVRIQICRDVYQEAGHFCMSDTGDEETKYRKEKFDNCGTF